MWSYLCKVPSFDEPQNQPARRFQPIPGHCSYSAAGQGHSGRIDHWIQLRSKWRKTSAFVFKVRCITINTQNVSWMTRGLTLFVDDSSVSQRVLGHWGIFHTLHGLQCRRIHCNLVKESEENSHKIWRGKIKNWSWDKHQNTSKRLTIVFCKPWVSSCCCLSSSICCRVKKGLRRLLTGSSGWATDHSSNASGWRHCTCRRKFFLCLVMKWHISQEKGFSPVENAFL